MDYDNAVSMHNPFTMEPAVQRDEELPEMWEAADLIGGAADAEDGYLGPRDGCGFLHRHECDGTTCDGSKDVPGDGDPFIDPDDGDDTRREDEPGGYFIADFDGECSRGGETFKAGDSLTIRADGDGGWECRGCVDNDHDPMSRAVGFTGLPGLPS